MLDDALSGSGLTREDLGWVGGEVGGYADVGAGSPSYAVMIASDDNGAASSALQKMRDASGTTYTSSTVDGVEVWAPATSDQPTEAIVDDTVVLAIEPRSDADGDHHKQRRHDDPGRRHLHGRDGQASRRQPRVRLRERRLDRIAREPHLRTDGRPGLPARRLPGRGLLDLRGVRRARRSMRPSRPTRASSLPRNGRRWARDPTRCSRSPRPTPMRSWRPRGSGRRSRTA